MTEIADTFDSAFTKAVDLGNRLADKDKDADLWDIADGLLAVGNHGGDGDRRSIADLGEQGGQVILSGREQTAGQQDRA